jgi:hypothetical protein
MFEFVALPIIRAAVALAVIAVALRPSRLIEIGVRGSEGRLVVAPVEFGVDIARPRVFAPPRLLVGPAEGRLGFPDVIAGDVVDRVLQFPRHIVVGLVEKADKSVNLVPGVLAESSYRLKNLLGGKRPSANITNPGPL